MSKMDYAEVWLAQEGTKEQTAGRFCTQLKLNQQSWGDERTDIASNLAQFYVTSNKAFLEMHHTSYCRWRLAHLTFPSKNTISLHEES